MDKNLLANVALDTFIEIFDKQLKTNAIDLNGLDKIISFRIGEGKDVYYSLKQDGISKLNGKQKVNIVCLFLDIKHFFDFLNGKRRPLFVKGLRLYKSLAPILDGIADKFCLGIKCDQDSVEVVLPLYKSVIVNKIKTKKNVDVRIGENVEGDGIIVTYYSKYDLLSIYKGKLLHEFVEGKCFRIIADDDDYDAVLNALKSISIKDFI